MRKFFAQFDYGRKLPLGELVDALVDAQDNLKSLKIPVQQFKSDDWEVLAADLQYHFEHEAPKGKKVKGGEPDTVPA
jgi:hypothetical protein